MTTPKKYQVLDDSFGDIHGQILFESDERTEANDFYEAYEKEAASQVGLLRWNPEFKKARAEQQ